MYDGSPYYVDINLSTTNRDALRVIEARKTTDDTPIDAMFRILGMEVMAGAIETESIVLMVIVDVEQMMFALSADTRGFARGNIKILTVLLMLSLHDIKKAQKKAARNNMNKQ